MKRQILLPLLPAENDLQADTVIAQPTSVRNLVGLNQLFSAFGYRLVLAISDEFPLPPALAEAPECAELMSQAVTLELLEQRDMVDFSALMVLTDLPFKTLSALDSIDPLQQAIAHFYTASKVVVCQNPDDLTIISPRNAMAQLGRDPEARPCVNSLRGLEAYVSTVVELIADQTTRFLKGDQLADQHLQAASVEDSTPQ